MLLYLKRKTSTHLELSTSRFHDKLEISSKKEKKETFKTKLHDKQIHF